MINTFREKTVKNKTLNDVISQAKSILKTKHGINQVCNNKFHFLPSDTMFTVQEMDKLVNDIVDDTLFWG